MSGDVGAECEGCACPAEHDGDYGSAGHSGPCPPHTCGDVGADVAPSCSKLPQGLEVADVAAALADHMWNGCTVPACDPGKAADDIPRPFVHHLAAVVEPLIAGRVEAAKAEALREAADAAEAHNPNGTHRHSFWTAGPWLRARAAALDS